MVVSDSDERREDRSLDTVNVHVDVRFVVVLLGMIVVLLLDSGLFREREGRRRGTHGGESPLPDAPGDGRGAG